jgi:hypothetical protein
MQRGALRVLRGDPDADEDAASGATPPPRSEGAEGAVERDGFNLHASVAIAADDDLGRERLMRYGARPPLALDRLRWLPGGRIAYRIKTLRDGRAKHRIMTPLEFLARLAALVPPPRYPLLRYHGVLAPRSAWRRDVVPRAPQAKACAKIAETTTGGPRPESRDSSPPGCLRGREGGGAPFRGVSSAPKVARSPAGNQTPPALGVAGVAAPPEVGAVALTPNVLSVKHWSRLLGGLLYAASPRVDWPTLLRRSFDVDVLSCSICGGRLRVLGEITEPGLVGLVLDRLGMPAEAPRVARARDPTELLGEGAAD